MGKRWSQLWKKAIAEEVGRSAPARTRQHSPTRVFPSSTKARRQLPDPNLCLYVIGFRDSERFPYLRAIKIGVTNNFEKRLATFQTASPWELEVKAIRLDPNAYQMERWLHEHFAPYRMRRDGEWFMPPPDVDVVEWVSNA